MIDFIKRHEGLRLVCYLCPAGIPTIGYGHTRTLKKSDVGKLRITKERAEELLEDDLREAKAAATAVTGFSSGPVFWAVTSFVFNLGPGALHGKTTQVGRHLINRDYTKAVLGMKRYVYGGGRRLPGLVKRRAEEGEMIHGVSK
jgi:lysozyme